MIGFDARVLAIRPHPEQATHNPGYWAVQISVSREGQKTRTFWRWFNTRRLNESGVALRPDETPPTPEEVLARFWDDTFAELHGFAFEMAE